MFPLTEKADYSSTHLGMNSSSLSSHAGTLTPCILGVALTSCAFDFPWTLGMFQANMPGSGSNLDRCSWNSASGSSRHIKESLERIMAEGEELYFLNLLQPQLLFICFIIQCALAERVSALHIWITAPSSGLGRGWSRLIWCVKEWEVWKWRQRVLKMPLRGLVMKRNTL